MVGRPAGVGVMLYDPEIGAMAGEAIKDIGRLVRRRRDHVDVVGRALIGIVRVEAEAMIDAVAGVDVAAGCASLRAPEKLRSEEHTSELQSLMRISYAVFCLKKKKNKLKRIKNIMHRN